MPRRATPYPWRGWYVTNIGGRRQKLCRLERGAGAAEEALDRLKVKRHENGGVLPPKLSIAEIAAQFLQFVETEKAQATFVYYKSLLQPFVNGFEDEPAINPPFTGFGTKWGHELRLIDGVAYKKILIDLGYEPCTINHHVSAAKTVLNWAAEDAVGYLTKNPWKKIKKLAERGRERIVTDEDFRALLRHCSDTLFKQILFILRYTAARPGELRRLTWEMVKWETHCWVIPARQTKTGTTTKEPKARIIPILPEAEALLRWRLKTYGKTERVFPALNGDEWRKDTFSQRFRRLRERAGIEPDGNGEQLVPYSLRHTRLTEAAIEGVAAPMLQNIAGHTTFRMTQRYLHLNGQDTYNAVMEARNRRRQSPK